jgi:hypothetical protein
VVILPFLVAEIGWLDSIYIFLTFVLLLLVFRACAPSDNEHRLQPRDFICAGIAIVACSVALLPLVKGRFAGTTFFCGGLSFLVLLQRRPSAAVAFAGLAIATASAAWVATGQPVSARLAKAPSAESKLKARAERKPRTRDHACIFPRAKEFEE